MVTMPYKDPEKRREWQREHYARVDVSRQKTRRDRFMALINRYKSLCGCSRCGEKDFRCLDLHHKDPSTKLAAVSLMSRSGSAKSIKEEIRKCEVICANCHRKLHLPM